MKFKLIILILCTGFLSIQKENSHLIIPKQGIGSIVLNKSSLKDVIKAYGEKKISKKWHKSVEFDLFGKFEYFIQVEGVGRFSTLSKNRNKNIIKKITLDSTSLCRTKNGFGIGSTYSSAIDQLGKPMLMHHEVKNPNQQMRLILIYDHYMEISFNGTDTLTSKVEEIILW